MKRPSGLRPADTERTPTHTPRFSRVRESPGRPVPPFRVFPLVARTPSTRHRITRVARVRNPSAENRSHIQKFYFPRSSSCVLYPRHTAHIHATVFSFTLAKTIAPYTFVRFLCCVFSNSPFRFHGATKLRTLHLNFPDLLSFVSSINWKYDNPESEPQEPGHRRQKPGPA